VFFLHQLEITAGFKGFSALDCRFLIAAGANIFAGLLIGLFEKCACLFKLLLNLLLFASEFSDVLTLALHCLCMCFLGLFNLLGMLCVERV
jgi:hypothetical protein